MATIYDSLKGFRRTRGYILDKNGDGKPEHAGIDYYAKEGTPIPVVRDGTVWYSGYNNTYGNTVIIRHEGADGNIFYTLYAHMTGDNMPTLGASVSTGNIIGEVGNTGRRSRGPHLHYEIIDPPDTITPTYGNGGPIGFNYGQYRLDPDTINIAWLFEGDYSQVFGLWGITPANSIFGVNPDDWQMLFTAATSLPPPAPRGDPLVLDLDGDGTETTSLTDGAYFDHDANGFAERTGWAGSDDGLLVWDRNGDGVINSGREVFGDQTILKTGVRATNGFQALAEWDGNLDGKIDINDAIWSNLRVWQDFDGDGYSSGNEIYTLNDLGIAALNTGNTSVNITDSNGNIRTLAGTYRRTDGTTGQMNNYTLRRDSAYTIANEWLEVPSEIAVLPDLQGYGNVYDLHQAMVRERLMGQGEGLKGLIDRKTINCKIS